MKEAKINITKNGNYNNIKLTDINPDEYIVVSKKYATGKAVQTKFGERFTCAVTYQDQVCSFFLNEKQHIMFSECGGEGDTIKISKTEEKMTNKKTKVTMLIPVLHFELVE